MAYYDEQDDPETAAESSSVLPDLSPEEIAWYDTEAREASRLAAEATIREWEANPPVTTCRVCCRELPPDPSGELYPTCYDCRAEPPS